MSDMTHAVYSKYIIPAHTQHN